MSLSLERQLCFYGAYHHNKINLIIHSICVPLLLASGLTVATNSPTLITLPSWLTVPNLDINFGTLAGLVFSGFYVLLEPAAGAVLLPVILGWTAYSRNLILNDPGPVNRIAIPLHVVCWLAQFVGHGVFERRSPALFDSFVQAVLSAPFFVFLEGLFRLGYRPELKKRVDKGIKEEIKKLDAQKANSNAKNGKTA